MYYVIIAVLAFVGGVVQSVTGFGCAIIMMMGFTPMFGVTTGAGVSSTCSIFLNSSLAIKYRKIINFRQLILPLIIFLPITAACIFISTSVNQDLLKRCFGGFLILLAVYYIFFKKKTGARLSNPVKIIFVVVSAICSALFGIGGPLMVLYFMSDANEPKEYIANTQMFFAITGIYNFVMRIINGIVGIKQLPYIVIGAVMIILGGMMGSKVMNKLNPQKVKQYTYYMIALAGIVNLIG